MSEKLRWRIAYLLDKLPGQCWSRLVDWVLYDPIDAGARRGSPWSPMSDVCRSDAERIGGCYCGKLRASEDRWPS